MGLFVLQTVETGPRRYTVSQETYLRRREDRAEREESGWDLTLRSRCHHRWSVPLPFLPFGSFVHESLEE